MSWLDNVREGGNEQIASIRASIGRAVGHQLEETALRGPAQRLATRVTAYAGVVGGSVIAFVSDEIRGTLGSPTLRCDWHPANPYLNSQERALSTLSHWLEDLAGKKAAATICVERIDRNIVATVHRYDLDQIPVGSLINVYV